LAASADRRERDDADLSCFFCPVLCLAHSSAKTEKRLAAGHAESVPAQDYGTVKLWDG
jgi:hypothetical protein